jgi:hypothetical protein
MYVCVYVFWEIVYMCIRAVYFYEYGNYAGYASMNACKCTYMNACMHVLRPSYS